MSVSKAVKTMIVASIAIAGLSVALMSATPDNLFEGDKPHAMSKSKAEQPKSYIVQGKKAETLKTAVTSVGGSVSREFPIINAVSAVLTPSQAEVISKLDDIRIQDDRSVATMSNGNTNKKFVIDNYIATQTDADKLHDLGITGLGVTVAVLDSGVSMAGQHSINLLVDSEGYWRVPAKYDAIKSRKTWWLNDDKNGHGSHVSGIIASSLKSENGKYNGIAPDVYLLSVKAFDRNGQSSYSKVLDGLNWIYHNRARYRIKVLNLSLGAEVQSNYWDDPINQAIMRLWDAGIVVVTSAGNSGHKDMGITVPGNNPYIITVGAITDSYTPFDFSDDRVTTFSSTGPTVEGFVKPEVVAYGGHVSAKVDKRFATGNFFESATGIEYQEISGTSQASAVVSGIAALMLQYNPYLSPDDVKCRIMASAKMAVNSAGEMAFSPFEQGHGMVNAYDAVASQATGCANRGLDIAADMAGAMHFMGPVSKSPEGKLAILAGDKLITEGHQWGDTGLIAEGHQWGDTRLFSEGHQWGDTGVFSEGHQWGDTNLFIEGHQWGDTSFLLEGHQWGDTGIFAEGHQWGDTGMFSEGHQWGDTRMLAEAWENRQEFIESTEQVSTPSDSVVIDEDGEEEVDNWQTTERAAPRSAPIN
ncbi:S8 family peptidase [Glaciecola sp. MH2013]|uniref:S8 family peptidase n=1 Tax=Glaciecola sp. MH2013 TaxID=2785524 RepID=UPI00189F66FC|nr:S8 family peptidase [Glaciecola sp. MH2013]MBF7073728.1 S8 family peptidase [Glaciecola sp. MH2013]